METTKKHGKEEEGRGEDTQEEFSQSVLSRAHRE